MTDTSDDVLGLGGGGGGDLPARTAEQTTRTAKPLEQGSEQAKRRRAIRRGSLLTRDFEPANLGTPGLLGIN